MALIAKVRLSNLEDHIVPSTKFGVVTFLEIFVEAVLGVMKDVIGKDYKKHVPLIGSLALFIFFSNFLASRAFIAHGRQQFFETCCRNPAG